MLEVSESKLAKYAMHYVGETVMFGDEPQQEINVLLEASLAQLAFYKMDYDQQYEFFHETNIDLNEVYTYAKTIFEQPESFHMQSKHIAAHLLSVSHHPNIKNGELFIGLFDECVWLNEVKRVLSIVKIEDKEMFLAVQQQSDKLMMNGIDGINVKRPSNQVIIVDMGPKEMPAVYLKTKKKDDVVYWNERFLKIKVADESYHNTNQVLTEVKKYILKEESWSNTSKLQYLNKTLEYFRNEEKFEANDYVGKVFEDVSAVQHDVLMSTVKPYETEISETAIAKAEKAFKRKIKLDSNVEIQVNVRDIEQVDQIIEVGFDEETGRKFYKIYFQEEQ